jgi:hypothetical protein
MTDLQLERFSRAFEDGDDFALMFAVAYCHGRKLPLPEWCFKAIETMFFLPYHDGTSARSKRGQHSAVDRRSANQMHYWRWQMVQDALSGDHPDQYGTPGSTEAAFAAVAEFVADAYGAEVSAVTIKRSYQLVERERKAGKGARFFDAFPRITS